MALSALRRPRTLVVATRRPPLKTPLTNVYKLPLILTRASIITWQVLPIVCNLNQQTHEMSTDIRSRKISDILTTNLIANIGYRKKDTFH